METNLHEQLCALLTALCAGAAAGLLYDLLGVGRGRGRVGRFLAASAFLLLTFLWLFLAGLFSEGGPGAGFLCGAAAGACLYFALAHETIARMLHGFWLYIHQNRRKTGKPSVDAEKIE